MTFPPNTIFEPPPFIQTVYKYQNINIDKNLQYMVTTKFLDKTIKWIENDNDFKGTKKYLSKLKNEDGYNIMYHILKLFVKKGNTNWYDLGEQEGLVRDFIKFKLKKKY